MYRVKYYVLESVTDRKVSLTSDSKPLLLHFLIFLFFFFFSVEKTEKSFQSIDKITLLPCIKSVNDFPSQPK